MGAKFAVEGDRGAAGGELLAQVAQAPNRNGICTSIQRPNLKEEKKTILAKLIR